MVYVYVCSRPYVAQYFRCRIHFAPVDVMMEAYWLSPLLVVRPCVGPALDPGGVPSPSEVVIAFEKMLDE